MVEVLDTNGINLWTADICRYARKHLLIISPYLKINEKLRRTVEDSVRHGVKLTVIYGKKELDKKTHSWLTSLPYCNLGYLETLHAKVVLNEDYGILSSMNLYEYSQVNNDELGVLMSRTQNPEYRELLRLCIEIINHSEKQLGTWDIESIDKPIRGLIHQKTVFVPMGGTCENDSDNGRLHCIRCGSDLPEDSDTVYCDKCLASWKRYCNTAYEEKNGHCLVCGKTMSVLAEKPSCPDCYKSHGQEVKARCRRMASFTKKT